MIFVIICILCNFCEIGWSFWFYGLYNGGVWFVLLMIFNVIWIYVLVCGLVVNNGILFYGNGVFIL